MTTMERMFPMKARFYQLGAKEISDVSNEQRSNHYREQTASGLLGTESDATSQCFADSIDGSALAGLSHTSLFSQEYVQLKDKALNSAGFSWIQPDSVGRFLVDQTSMIA